MVARLVAVDIHAQQPLARDVLGLGKVLVGQELGEEAVEARREPSVAPHQGDEPVGIVGHVHRVVPRVALDESLPVGVVAVEIGLPAAVLHAALREARRRIEDIAVVQGAPCGRRPSRRRRTRASSTSPSSGRRRARSPAPCRRPCRRSSRSRSCAPSPPAPARGRCRSPCRGRHPRPRPRGSRSCTSSRCPCATTRAGCRARSGRSGRASRPPDRGCARATAD